MFRDLLRLTVLAVTGKLDLDGHQKASLWIMSLAFGWFAIVSLAG